MKKSCQFAQKPTLIPAEHKNSPRISPNPKNNPRLNPKNQQNPVSCPVIFAQKPLFPVIFMKKRKKKGKKEKKRVFLIIAFEQKVEDFRFPARKANPLYLKIMRVLSDADRKRKDSLACQNELLEMPFNFENRFPSIHSKILKLILKFTIEGHLTCCYYIY